MIERIDDMPAGTLGFRGEGELSEDDFLNVLVPPLREAVATGTVRLLFLTPPEFGAGDVKAIVDRLLHSEVPGLGHPRDWNRIAVLTESNMLRRSSRVWKRMIPVKVEVFGAGEVAKAREWLVGD